MAFKFEQLEVWQLALNYIDRMYELADQLPISENFNLKSQIKRSATSVALNIAEGSTGQSDAEQRRFLGMALRSLIETVACQRIIRRRYLPESAILDRADTEAQSLAKRLHAFRKALSTSNARIRERQELYSSDEI